jgi:hypothetical protein
LDWYAELLAMLVDPVAVKSPPAVLVVPPVVVVLTIKLPLA